MTRIVSSESSITPEMWAKFSASLAGAIERGQFSHSIRDYEPHIHEQGGQAQWEPTTTSSSIDKKA